MPKIDLTGLRFGLLVVLKDVGRTSFGGVEWLCDCDCGSQAVVSSGNLRSGHIDGCGCRKWAPVHGYGRRGRNRSPEHSIWAAMLQRCNNPKCKAYADYGARGIRVCERWHKFESFLADMGGRPSKELTIERIDNDGNYEPSNCKWATRAEQTKNRRPTAIKRAAEKRQKITMLR